MYLLPQLPSAERSGEGHNLNSGHKLAAGSSLLKRGEEVMVTE